MRTPGVDSNGLRQGAWSAEEDRRLIDYISKYRIWNWSLMPKYAGLSRNGKSCRLRWVNYLDPNIRRGNISKDEEKMIIDMYAKLGSRWSKIAARLPGRTDNEIKNYWHTHLKKLFKEEPKKSIDPLATKIPKFEANHENSYGINKTAPTPSSAASGSEASNSYDSNNPTFSRESYDLREIDRVRIDSSETIADFHSFWAQPEVHFEDWYQEPLSPYGSLNNEFWLNEFGVMDGMEKPNFYYKGEF